MCGFGVSEIAIVFVLAVVLFGAKRLPELGRGLGQSIGEFKKGVKDLEGDLDLGLQEPVKLARHSDAAPSERSG